MSSTTTSSDAGSSSPHTITSGPLDQQRAMCDEAMSLVNAGVAMQSSGDHSGAERNLIRAVDIMEQALEIDYPSAEEQEAAGR